MPTRFRAGLGFTLIEPANDNGNLTGFGRIEIGSSKRPTIFLSYGLSPSWAVELMLGYPFKHTISRSGAGSLATVRQLPVALTVQYHVANRSRITPFVGAGLAFVQPFDAFGRNAIRERDLEFSSDFGFSLQAGLEYRISDRNGIRGEIRYLETSLDVRLEGQDIGAASFDPVFYSLSWVYGF